jgi:hypothetical protein
MVPNVVGVINPSLTSRGGNNVGLRPWVFPYVGLRECYCQEHAHVW